MTMGEEGPSSLDPSINFPTIVSNPGNYYLPNQVILLLASYDGYNLHKFTYVPLPLIQVKTT